VTTNHKVVSVEFERYEDVYNITVDDNHNYHVITSSEDDRYIVSSGMCVKNCGEIGLCAYDCCCLGALVLPRFIKETGAGPQIDWKLLKDSVKLGHRFLDNVLTVNVYPLPDIKETCQTIRRVGLGVMGLHDMLLMLGLKYSSAEGLEMVDKVMNFF
jgi:ribonucleoside-diphosphate reductase alpha chain